MWVFSQSPLVDLLVKSSFVPQHLHNTGPGVFGVLNQFLSDNASHSYLSSKQATWGSPPAVGLLVLKL